MPHNEEKLIRQHMGLVRSQALRLLARLPASIELDDLMQAGLMGLLDAVRRYTEQANAQFETYAITRIRGAMLDELRSQDWLSRSARSKARRLEQAVQRLRHELGHEPDEHAIAQELQLSLADYRQLLTEISGMQILHVEDLFRQNPDAGTDPLEVIGAADQTVSHALQRPELQLVAQALRQCVIGAINNLPEREQLLLSLQFEHDLNQKEIAQVMELSEGRISQLRSQAISRIRAYLEAHHWDQRPADIDIGALL